MQSDEDRNQRTAYEVVRFGANLTLHWETAGPQLLIWIRWRGFFSESPRLDIIDMWKIESGDRVDLTNRMDDIPAGFELHPTETHGANVYRMMAKLRAGYEPVEPMDGPNIWRVLAGDRILRVYLTSQAAKTGNDRLTVVEFNENALAYAEINDDNRETAMLGRDVGSNHSPEEMALVRAGIEAIREVGIPRVCLAGEGKWTIGS